MPLQAKAQCQKVLQCAPDHAEAHYLLGVIAVRAGRLPEASKHFADALQRASNNPAGHNNFGAFLKQLGQLDQARVSFETAIAQKADYAEAWIHLGNLLQIQEQPERSLEALGQGIKLRPDIAEAHHNRGQLLLQLGRIDGALLSLKQAVALRPDYASAFNQKAHAHLLLNRPDLTLLHAERALALNSKLADAHYHRSLALWRLKRFEAALSSFETTLALSPAHTLAMVGRAGLNIDLRRFEPALQDLDQALALAPDLLEAHENRALAAAGAKRHSEAVASYQRLIELNPNQPYVKGNLLHAKMLACDWEGLDSLRATLEQDLAVGLPAAEPFGYQGISESEDLLLRCAEIYAAREYPSAKPIHGLPVPAVSGASAAKDPSRITIGYLCGEFRQHATTILMAGVYEAHDRERFQCLAFDSGVGDESIYRQRVLSAFEQVIDISRMSEEQAAAVIAQHQVDVLVDLNGYYGAERTGLLALRPAPVQVNYLGFPGTLGAPYMDYLLADEVVVPPTSLEFYAEKVVYLPHCYQANDRQRKSATVHKTRADMGLPADGFVYCCFNNSYKITPNQFASWMRILQRVENSYLWLMEDAPDVSSRLRQAASSHGLDPTRLVFASRLPPDEHLARHTLADLFLDTQPYNAHTTASDALWTGLPVLTCRGKTFPGRVASSLLYAMGLEALVTDSVDAYEELAVELAKAPERLAGLRTLLQSRRLTHPLFDTKLMTRHLESAYGEMVARHQRGQKPAHFRVGV